MVYLKILVKDLPFVAGQGLMKGSEGLTSGDSIEPIQTKTEVDCDLANIKCLIGYHHGGSRS